MDTAVFCPNWVCRDGVTYQNNTAYVIIGYDGLDPVLLLLRNLLSLLVIIWFFLMFVIVKYVILMITIMPVL